MMKHSRYDTVVANDQEMFKSVYCEQRRLLPLPPRRSRRAANDVKITRGIEADFYFTFFFSDHPYYRKPYHDFIFPESYFSQPTFLFIVLKRVITVVYIGTVYGGFYSRIGSQYWFAYVAIHYIMCLHIIKLIGERDFSGAFKRDRWQFAICITDNHEPTTVAC